MEMFFFLCFFFAFAIFRTSERNGNRGGSDDAFLHTAISS